VSGGSKEKHCQSVLLWERVVKGGYFMLTFYLGVRALRLVLSKNP